MGCSRRVWTHPKHLKDKQGWRGNQLLRVKAPLSDTKLFEKGNLTHYTPKSCWSLQQTNMATLPKLSDSFKWKCWGLDPAIFCMQTGALSLSHSPFCSKPFYQKERIFLDVLQLFCSDIHCLSCSQRCCQRLWRTAKYKVPFSVLFEQHADLFLHGKFHTHVLCLSEIMCIVDGYLSIGLSCLVNPFNL